MQVRIQQLGPGMMQQIQSMCSECQGQGERIDPKLRCKKCNGRKVNRERKILEVQIDKGMEDGQKITFGGEGDQVIIVSTYFKVKNTVCRINVSKKEKVILS